MKNKRSLFSPVISIIYIATVVTFVVSLFVEYKSSPAKIKARVDELARATTQNLSVNQPGSDQFETALLHSIGYVSDIAGIQLSQNGELLFSLPGDLAENSPTLSPFVTVTERPIYAKDQDEVQMKVASYLIQPSSLYIKGLIAFFIILATTLFCITYLIYLYASDKKGYDSGLEDKFASKKKSKKIREETEDDLSFSRNDDFIEPLVLDQEKTAAGEFDGPQEYAQNDAYDEYDPLPDFPDGEAELDDFEEDVFNDEATQVLNDEEYSEPNLEEQVELRQSKSSDSEDDGQAPDHKADMGKEIDEENLRQETEQEDSEVQMEDEAAAVEESPDLKDSDDSAYSDFQMPVSPSSTITQEEYQALTKDLLDEPESQENDDFLGPLIDDEETSISEEEEIEGEKKLTEASSIRTKLDSPLQNAVEDDEKELPAIDEKEEKLDDVKKHPAGLFSPTTGFGWEEYMIPRLDSELIRAASGDQDLTLMTIEIPKIDWTSDEAKEISSLILDLVKFKDLLFEYGEFGCTAIIQNMGIEEALHAAEDLHTNIIASLARRKKYYIVAIGLSARSLRLISGSRIAKESEQALIHALEDKSNPVVAFKVNPERYRNYIASESAKLG